MQGILNEAVGDGAKRRSSWWLLALALLPALVWADARDDALPALDSPPPGIASYGDHTMPSYYDPVLLALGRDLYADLENMRDATQGRDITALRIQLHQANTDLDSMRLPEQRAALTHQEQMLRNDLGKRAQSLSKDLWLPLQVQVAESLAVAASDSTPAPSNDGASPAAPLYASLNYAVTIFPLNRISTLLDKVDRGIAGGSPDWAALRQTVQLALSSLQRYPRVPVTGLAGAYNAVSNADRLARSAAGKQSAARIRTLLQRARSCLASTQQASLTQQVDDLLRRQESATALRGNLQDLLSDLGSQIRFEQQRAQDRYWRMVGKGILP